MDTLNDITGLYIKILNTTYNGRTLEMTYNFYLKLIESTRHMSIEQLYHYLYMVLGFPIVKDEKPKMFRQVRLELQRSCHPMTGLNRSGLVFPLEIAKDIKPEPTIEGIKYLNLKMSIDRNLIISQVLDFFGISKITALDPDRYNNILIISKYIELFHDPSIKRMTYFWIICSLQVIDIDYPPIDDGKRTVIVNMFMDLIETHLCFWDTKSDEKSYEARKKAFYSYMGPMSIPSPLEFLEKERSRLWDSLYDSGDRMVFDENTEDSDLSDTHLYLKLVDLLNVVYGDTLSDGDITIYYIKEEMNSRVLAMDGLSVAFFYTLVMETLSVKGRCFINDLLKNNPYWNSRDILSSSKIESLS